MDKLRLLELQKQATIIRKYIIDEVFSANSGHPGGSLSCTDIFTTLYFDASVFQMLFNDVFQLDS